MVTKVKVPKRFATSKAVFFCMEKIRQYDLTHLGEIRVWDKPMLILPDAYGNHKHPSYRSARTSRHRISITIRAEDSALPCKYKPRFPPKYGRKYRPVGLYGTIDECLVWLFGHEMYHFLAKHRQLPGDYKDEVEACCTGEAWVEEFRLWKEER